jgi:hypothetical protein
VYRFNGSRWQEEAILTPSDGATADGFGYAVSISGEVIAVSTKLSLRGSTPSTGAYFGSAVAVEQNVAIIGAPGSAPGVAYVYRWDGTVWREQKILTASDGTTGNRFGAAVSISGRLAMVGAPGNRYSSSGGAAYVYVLD